MSQILGLIIKFAIVRAVISLGVGVLTYGSVIYALNKAIEHVKTMYNGMPPSVLNFLAIAGMPEVLGILCGALIARASLQFVRRLALLGG